MNKSINKTKSLFKKAYFHNWDEGLDILKKITNDINCDKATATMIFWHGTPDYYYSKEISKLEPYEKEMYDFLKILADKILSEQYPTIISYKLENNISSIELGNIPKELITPIIGTIDYKAILYPNNNPFDEQITALCKNCNDVNEMYELEKKGADFSLKINKGYSYPITIACNYGQTEALKYFIEKKYDLNKKHNKIPLFWGAVYNKQVSVINLILENGCDINQKGEFGRTILHDIAGVFARNQEGFDLEMQNIVTLLVKKGANINALDSDKKTPLDLSIMWDNVKFINYLNQIKK